MVLSSSALSAPTDGDSAASTPMSEASVETPSNVATPSDVESSSIDSVALDGAPATPLADERPPPARNPSCVSFSAQAVYRSGYEHRVHIANGCNKMVSCDVNTDVTPGIITARVSAHSMETVLTRRGSPSYSFVANVVCKLVR